MVLVVTAAEVGRVMLPTGMNSVYSSRFWMSSIRFDSYKQAVAVRDFNN